MIGLLVQGVTPPAATLTALPLSVGAEASLVAAAIVTVIAALAGAIVTVFNAVGAAQDRRDARVSRTALAVTTTATSQKADTIIEKAGEIHTLTNSNLAKVTAALEVANEKILGLEKLMAALVTAKDDAARAGVASRSDVAAALAVTPPPASRDGRHDRKTDPVQVEVVNVPLAVKDETTP